jgi:hypothetical protein
VRLGDPKGVETDAPGDSNGERRLCSLPPHLTVEINGRISLKASSMNGDAVVLCRWLLVVAEDGDVQVLRVSRDFGLAGPSVFRLSVASFVLGVFNSNALSCTVGDSELEASENVVTASYTAVDIVFW